MSLPPLPLAAVDEHNLQGGRLLYTHQQMKAYGQACRAAAIEEAAQVCSHKAETKRLFLNEAHYLECAEAIRRLK